MGNTNVTQKYDILEHVPHWSHKTLAVTVWNTEARINERHVISFSDLAAEFDPDNEGNHVVLTIIQHGNDPDAGPWSEPRDYPLTPNEFMAELLEVSKDPTMPEDTRQTYLAQLDEALSTIIERREES